MPCEPPIEDACIKTLDNVAPECVVTPRFVLDGTSMILLLSSDWFKLGDPLAEKLITPLEGVWM